MSIHRRFEIVYLLLNKDRMTAKELAGHFHVSARTIYRDVEELSSGGIPIYMSKGKNGGISLMPDYVLNKTILTEDEKRDILSALQGLHGLDANAVEATLSKLSSFFGQRNTGYIEVDYQDWGGRIQAPLEAARQAILSRKLLTFAYTSTDGQNSHRTVEPYKLWFKDRSWYVKAFCLVKNAPRVFRITRMRHAKVLEQGFVPRDVDFSMPGEGKTAFPTTAITMCVAPEAKHRVLDEFPEENIWETGDGSYLVTMDFIEDEWVYGYILSFGVHAKVIEPDRIRHLIKERLEKMLNTYS